MRLLFIAALAAILFACQGPAPPSAPGTAAPTEPTRERCFLSVTRSADGSIADSLRMRLSFRGDRAEGTYEWLPQEKDRMVGTLQGSLRNDTLTAVYTYQAEGVRSREQRLFLLKAGEAVVLSGEMVEREGLWVLRDPARAMPGMTLPEVPCQSGPQPLNRNAAQP
ncbi:MAG TPA: hypothetical protein VGE21_00360 [Flavobacteriales bacterium]